MRSMQWAILKERVPKDFEEVIILAQSVRTPLIGLKKTDNIARSRMRVLEARGRLNNVLSAVTSSFRQKEMLETNVERVIHFWLQENLGRLLKHVDDITKDIIKTTTEIKKYDLVMAGIEIESVLNNLYFAIKKSAIKFPRDKKDSKENQKKFLYCLWETTGTISGIFGAVTRSGGSGKAVSMASGGIPSYIPTVLSSMTKEDRETLTNELKENTDMPLPDILMSGKSLLSKK